MFWFPGMAPLSLSLYFSDMIFSEREREREKGRAKTREMEGTSTCQSFLQMSPPYVTLTTPIIVKTAAT